MRNLSSSQHPIVQVGADLVMNMVLGLMVVFKLITIKNALVGFGNSGLMTVVGEAAPSTPHLD